MDTNSSEYDDRLVDLRFVLRNISNGLKKPQYYDVDNGDIIILSRGTKYMYRSDVFRIVSNNKQKFDKLIDDIKKNCYIKICGSDVPLVF